MAKPNLKVGMKLKRILPQPEVFDYGSFAQLGEVVEISKLGTMQHRVDNVGFFYVKDIKKGRVFDCWSELDPNKEGKYIPAMDNSNHCLV